MPGVLPSAVNPWHLLEVMPGTKFPAEMEICLQLKERLFCKDRGTVELH